MGNDDLDSLFDLDNDGELDTLEKAAELDFIDDELQFDEDKEDTSLKKRRSLYDDDEDDETDDLFDDDDLNFDSDDGDD
ncbi:MAG TPA: hypothetical protein PLT66_06185 [Bacillota bacterium]|nr:hypothetical protein [Bacillota bacterium]